MNHTIWFAPEGGKHRHVEVECTYTCQRWPEGTELVHKKSKRPVVIKRLEFQGYWAAHTARFHRDPTTGYPLERHVSFPMYLVTIPSLDENRYLHEDEMQPA